MEADAIPSIDFKKVQNPGPEQIYNLLNHKSRLLQPNRQKSLTAYHQHNYASYNQTHSQASKRRPVEESTRGVSSAHYGQHRQL